MVGLPIVLPSAASMQTPSSQTAKKPAVRGGQRSLPQATAKHNASSTKAATLHAPEHERAQLSGSKQHSEPAQEPAPGLNDLVSIITNPDHPRSKECCIDLIAASLRATTGNSVLASKLANVLASSLEKAGGASTAEQQQQRSSDTAQATSSTEPAPLPEPEHEQVQRRKQHPQEPSQEPVAKRPRLSLSQATSKQPLGSCKPAGLAETGSVTAPEQPQLKSSGPQEIDWDGSDITPSNGKKHLNEIMAEMRKLHPAHEIEPQPVYLGFIKPLTNTKHFMTRAQVRAWVLAHRSSLYFCDYFDKNGVRKVPFHIDHIIPDSLGGADHPRNYALMPEIFNQRFSSWWMPAKAQYIGHTAARSAIIFAKYIKKKYTREITLHDLEEM
eukprot:g41697.t1